MRRRRTSYRHSKTFYCWRRYHLELEVESGYCTASSKRAAMVEVRAMALKRLPLARRYSREMLKLTYGYQGIILATWSVSTSGVVRL